MYTGQNALLQILDQLWNSAVPHVIITGDGGMGKTTVLLNTAMRQGQQAILYISMEQLQAQRLSIEQQICRTLFGTGEARDKLFQLTNTKRTQPALMLLLDGFNELTQTESQYIKELRGLSAYPGIQIAVTSRENFEQRYRINFNHATLMELSEEQICNILSEEEWTHIKDRFTLKKLLKNPMLLLMYKQICPIIGQHSNAFLAWIDPIANATQLIHNYFSAQIAVLLDRGEVTGEKLLKAYKCIGYALPYIGFWMEKENHLSISCENFESLVEEAERQARQCSFLDKTFRRVRREYREGAVPDITAFEIEDYLVKETHLLHEEDGWISFSHQIYRDYMSAVWIVYMSTTAEAIEAIWNQRDFPDYIADHIRNMTGRYWEGLAEQIASRAREREGAEVRTQICNLIRAFPYTQESGVPDFSGLDLRGIRLPDYSKVSGRIQMKSARIDTISLALQSMKPVVYQELSFSADDEWLAGLSEGTLHVWSMQTGTQNQISQNGKQLKAVHFTRDGQHLLLAFTEDNKRVLDVYTNNESWSYQCTIADDFYKPPRRMSIAGDLLYIYYSNRERRYSLSDAKLIYNKKKPKTWTVPETGETLPEMFASRRISNRKKGLPDGVLCQSRSVSGEFSARSYVDGTLTIFHEGERYLTLQQGINLLKAAAISGDGKRAVTLSQKTFGKFRKVQLWDLERKSRCGEMLCSDSIHNIHLSTSGDWIVGEMNGMYWIWNWSDQSAPYTKSGQFLSNQHGKLTFYENQIIYRDEDGLLKLYDLDTRTTKSLENSKKSGKIATIMPNGELVIIGNDAKRVVFRSIRGNWKLDINRENAAVTGLLFMKNEPFVAVATSNKKLSIYHTGTGQRLRILEPGSGNNIFVAHPSKDSIACSGGGSTFEIFHLYTKVVDGQKRSWWYQNPLKVKLDGKVLDMAFNEINGELVTIMSDGMIVYCHELYCEYHGHTKIITNFNVDAYDFTDVICDAEIRKVLTSNGAKL